MDYQNFMNIDVNMKEFEDVYNTYTDKKINFGGGNMKLSKLVNKFFGGRKIIGGAEYGNGTDNLFYALQNTNTSATSVNQLSDLIPKSQLFPDYMNTSRS